MRKRRAILALPGSQWLWGRLLPAGASIPAQSPVTLSAAQVFSPTVGETWTFKNGYADTATLAIHGMQWPQVPAPMARNECPWSGRPKVG